MAESFTATASSAGAVTIQFVTVKDNAQVNGIEVQPAGGGTGNTVTVTNPGAQTWTVGTAASLQIHATDSASGQTLTYSATGLPAGLSINSSTGLISGTPTTAGTGSTTVTVKDTTGASGSATFSWTVNPQATGCVGGSNQPNFGPNVYIFSPSKSATTINNTLNTVFNTQKVNQFGTQRYAELFDPGTYTGVEDNVGYYTSVQGLGQNPDQVSLNSSDVTVDSFDGTGNATQNFWRSAENMEITPSAGNDRWAVAQAGPFERMDVHGGLELYPASFGYASGGYIADSMVTGQASSVSQQQWYTKDSNLGSWSGSVWNMVFSGVNGAPAQSYPTPPMTTLATTPVARDIPYLYVDSSGNYNVFEPSLRTNASGPSWSASSNTPGTSVPMSQFFVATPSNTAAQINAALAQGCNLLFTPGVYNINQTLNVTNPNTVVLGLGFPTLIPTGGVDTMHVADVDGVRLQGLLFDAGTTNSNTLLTGRPGRATTASHATNPISVQDVFFRIGGDIAGPGHQQPGRQRQQHPRRRHLGLARRPRQLRHRRLDRQHGPARPRRQRQQRPGDRPVRRALPELRRPVVRQRRRDHLLPERDALRPAEPGGLDERLIRRVRRLRGRPERDHPPGLRARQLLLLQRQPGGGRRPRLRGADRLRRPAPRPAHRLPRERRRHRARHQRDRRGDPDQHHPVHRHQLPVTKPKPVIPNG